MLSKIQKITGGKYLWIVYLLLCSVLIFNVGNEIYSILHRAFQVDEFQHLHIAWNVFHYKEILYKDFWEHHGPLYPGINYIWFSMFNLGANIQTFFFMRWTSFVYTLLLLFFTYKIAYESFSSRFVALTSVVIFSSLFHFQTRGIEIRPDVIQNVFWLSGIYTICLYMRNATYFLPYVAGLLFGLCIGLNTKAGLGIVLVLLFFLVTFFLKKSNVPSFFVIASIFGGIATIQFFIFLYFILNGAVYDYYFNSVYANFILLQNISIPDVFPFLFWESFITTSALLLPLSIMGVLFLLFQKETKYQMSQMLLPVLTVGCTLSAPIGPWDSYYLTFFPLLSICSAYALGKIIDIRKFDTVWKVSLLSICLLALLVTFRIPSRNFYDNLLIHKSLQSQLDNTEYILTATEEGESVGYFWNNCGGSVFNKDVQYYWLFDRDVFGRTYTVLSGEDAYGDGYIAALRAKHVNYIVAMPQEVADLFSESTRNYILENFTRINDCILKKKTVNQESLELP